MPWGVSLVFSAQGVLRVLSDLWHRWTAQFHFSLFVSLFPSRGLASPFFLLLLLNSERKEEKRKETDEKEMEEEKEEEQKEEVEKEEMEE